MWSSLILIIIATCAGLFTLWSDQIIALKKEIPKEETADQKRERLEKELREEKSKRIKWISSCFILLTLGLTIYQIKSSYSEALQAKKDKKQQHIDDSIAHRRIDSTLILQNNEYKFQIATGKTIDSISIKSGSIFKNLKSVDSITKCSAGIIDKSSKLAEKSFSGLNISSKRLLYPIDSNITTSFSFGFWNKKSEEVIADYIKKNNLTDDLVNIDENFPYYNELQSFLKGIYLKLDFYNANTKDLMGPKKHRVINYYEQPAIMYLINL
jgi:hypothetical protein